MQLSRRERIQRMGELLSKGVNLMLSREAQGDSADAVIPQAGPSSPHPMTGSTLTPPLKEPELQILAYLQRVGGASPREVQSDLCISKATAFRALARMMHLNVVFRSGTTTSVRYQLTAVPLKADA
jgi:uncharacterized membrane protein